MIINEQKKIEYQGTTVWRYRLDNCIPIIADIIYSSMAKQMDKMAEKQQRKFVFCIGGEVRGMAWIKMYDVSDYADYYRAGGLKVVKRAGQCKNAPPTYLIEQPDMATYEWRGARMLSVASYKGKCFQCGREKAVVSTKLI